MPKRNRERDEYFKTLDSERQVMRAGGVNGKASIRGVPTRIGADGTVGVKAAMRTGIVSEPVAVLLRDAVTMDTACRLTGMARLTLQHAVKMGYIPAMRLGTGKSPYIVRIRDVITYLTQQSMAGRRRSPRSDTEGTYLGFEEWFADIVRESIDPDKSTDIGRYQPQTRVVHRGGRPLSVRKLETAADMIQTPQEGDGETVEELDTDHALAAATAPEEEPLWEPPSREERTKLPKWHPLWIRPGT